MFQLELFLEDKLNEMWNTIIEISEWFGEMMERRKIVKSFNEASKRAFINGIAPTLLEAKIVIGESEYNHTFSKYLTSGFKIKALSGKSLTKSEKIDIGRIVTDNTEFVRNLIYLGWDTLYVYADKDTDGLKWKLIEHAKLGQQLTERKS